MLAYSGHLWVSYQSWLSAQAGHMGLQVIFFYYFLESWNSGLSLFTPPHTLLPAELATTHPHGNTCSHTFSLLSKFFALFCLLCFSTRPRPHGPVRTSSSSLSSHLSPRWPVTIPTCRSHIWILLTEPSLMPFPSAKN